MEEKKDAIIDMKKCPECDHHLTKVGSFWICPEHGQIDFKNKQTSSLRIFLSYGHDSNEELVRLIMIELEKRGHDVWFDKKDIEHNDDWREAITRGIINSNKVISFLSKYSIRDPGVCLDEIRIAIGVKGGNIQTILVESEKEVKSPPSVSHKQWLDMQGWKKEQDKGGTDWQKWFNEKMAEIIMVVESEESKRFAGEIEKLSKFLNPISYDSRLKQLLSKKFVGRKWLMKELEKWRINPDRSSRLFWIMGDPGVGKSAFAANFAHFGRDKIIAVQFCEWDKNDHRNAGRVFRSIAFQLATRLPDYRKLLLTLPEIDKLDNKSAAEIFDYLLGNPLQSVIDGGQERYLILIDALDEASEGERNPLVETLARHVPRLPKWLGMVVTSRPESSVTSPLLGLNPYILDTSSEENKNDIRDYLHRELESLLEGRNDSGQIIGHILEKSEGVFLYVEMVCDDLDHGYLSLDQLGKFPVGLSGIFRQFFDRQFPDLNYFNSKILPALRCILAALEPLPLDILRNLFTWQEEEMYGFIRKLGSLFPTLEEDGRKVIKAYHKSLIDWLTEQTIAIHYYVNPIEGHRILAEYGWQQYKNNPETMDVFFIKWLPAHLQTLANWNDLTDLLSDLDFIQAKCVAEMTYDLVKDYNNALEVIPDNTENIRKEEERQARLDKYAEDLVLYAKGEISELDIPDSITPWNKERIDREIERIRINPTRLDILIDFYNFLGQEADNLQKLAREFPLFVTQQAWNHSDSGPLAGFSNKGIHNNVAIVLLHSHQNRPKWSPFPSQIKKLEKEIQYSSSYSSICISPNGKLSIAARGTKILLWNTDNGECRTIFDESSGNIQDICMTPNGKLVISANFNHTLSVWDLISEKRLKILKGHNSPVLSVCLSHDGKKIVSGSWDGILRVWDTDSGKCLRIIKISQYSIDCIKINHNGKLAFVPIGVKNLIALWNLESGKCVQVFFKNSEYVTRIDLSADGKRLISCSHNKTIRIWDVEKGRCLNVFKGYSEIIIDVSLSSDGKIAASVEYDKTIRIWDVEKGRCIKIFSGHTAVINRICLNADGKVAITAASDKTLRLWDIEKGETNTEKYGKSSVYGVCITTDNLKFLSSKDNNILIWKAKNGMHVNCLKGNSKDIYKIIISSDNKRVVSTDFFGSLRIWELDTGKYIDMLNVHSDSIRSMCITPDGMKIISASWDKTIQISDLKTGECLITLKGHTAGIDSICLSISGKRIISASENIRVWDIERAQCIKILEGSNHLISMIKITPDGQIAISAGDHDRTIRIWNIKNGICLKILQGHHDWVEKVFISSNGRFIISTSMDNTLRIWELNSGKCLKTLYGHTHGINDICISLDNNSIFSVSGDRTLRMWDIENGNCVTIYKGVSAIFSLALSIYGDIVLGLASGKTTILKISNYKIYPPSVTIKQIWDFNYHKYLAFSVDCPFCGHRFAPSGDVQEAIRKITKEAGLSSDQSPCMELPNVAWGESGLLSTCPKCGEKLKFNPFVADDSELDI